MLLVVVVAAVAVVAIVVAMVVAVVAIAVAIVAAAVAVVVPRLYGYFCLNRLAAAAIATVAKQ